MPHETVLAVAIYPTAQTVALGQSASFAVAMLLNGEPPDPPAHSSYALNLIKLTPLPESGIESVSPADPLTQYTMTASAAVLSAVGTYTFHAQSFYANDADPPYQQFVDSETVTVHVTRAREIEGEMEDRNIVAGLGEREIDAELGSREIVAGLGDREPLVAELPQNEIDAGLGG